MRRNFLKPQSTFQKLALAFLVIGVLPLLLVCLILMRSYENTAQRTIESNMQEANFFAHNKVCALVESIDSSMSLLYDYSTGSYNALWEILERDTLPESERQNAVGSMLERLLQTDSSISAAYFVRPDGTTYSRFYSQQKALRLTSTARHTTPAAVGDDLRQLCILPVANEGEWCSGSSDRVLTLGRNYMDTRSLYAVSTVSLGTLYIDLRTEALDELLATLQLGAGGNVTIVAHDTGSAVYQLYPENEQLLPENLAAESGSFTEGDYTVYYQPIGTVPYSLVVSFDRSELYSIHTSNRTYFALLLFFAVVLVLTVSLLFSGRISTPARQLKRAMEEVRSGNLTARVDIHSGDEMEYLGNGFNQMVEELRSTVDEVYMAQILQRDAELNALKMQIQPHYLYNTLDMIRMNALDSGDQRTARLIESLSRQMRHMMSNHQKRVTLRQELDITQEYGYLMSIRSEGQIRIRIEVEDRDLGLFVPSLLLQPFVENAVKHGLKEKRGGGTILIDAARIGEVLQIMVFNDGLPIDSKRLAHIRQFLENSPIGAQDEAGIVSVGMKNTYDRIKINCGSEYGFTIDSDENMGVVVTIRLPVWREEDPHVESTAGR
ncbi:MAG: sensor histidine kinase [Oscillospiraceae bacterium]|nr:sensor histidine kinase [Oscillospiraceae bacterium]